VKGREIEMTKDEENNKYRQSAVLNTSGENLAHKIIELLIALLIASKIPGNYKGADVQAHALAELVALVISLRITRWRS
jgi:hypothetical protein